MRIKVVLVFVISALYLFAGLACGQNSTPDNSNQNANSNQNTNSNQNNNTNNNQNSKDNSNTNANGNVNGNQNANDNGSGQNKFPVAAGLALPAWPQGSTNPALAFDGQGHLNLFYQTPTPSSGRVLAHATLNADGTWGAAAPASTEFQFLTSQDLILDASGKLCVLWSGSQYDKTGNSVYGLFRNCQKADGSFAAGDTQLANTSTPAVLSVAQTNAGALRAVYVNGAVLDYSAIVSPTTKVLSGTPLSESKSQILQGRLTIDSNGGYHAAWEETGGGEAITIQARDSTDGGKTWSAAKQLYSGSAGNPGRISLQLVADSAGQAHLAWDSDQGIWYSRWAAAGGWGKAVKLSTGTGLVSGVQLAVTKDGLARAVWNEYGKITQVALAEQAAGGAWGPVQTVTPTQGREEALAVDAQGTNHVVWRSDLDARYLALP